jgi:hypothetical protein
VDHILEKVLDPSIVWVFIPLLAILFWGLTSMVRALRGEPEEFEAWKAEMRQLRARVDELERGQHGPRPGKPDPHIASSERPV